MLSISSIEKNPSFLTNVVKKVRHRNCKEGHECVCLVKRVYTTISGTEEVLDARDRENWIECMQELAGQLMWPGETTISQTSFFAFKLQQKISLLTIRNFIDANNALPVMKRRDPSIRYEGAGYTETARVKDALRCCI